MKSDKRLSIRLTRRSLLPIAVVGGLSLGAIVSLQHLVTVANAADLPVVRVASDPSFLPFAFMNSTTHEMDGFDVDMMKAIGKVAGFQVQIVPLDFAGIIPALQSGNVDAGASSITITEPRKKVIDFSSPYYNSGLQILVREDRNDISSIEDLKGKIVAALTGSTGYNFADEKLGSSSRLVPFPSAATAILSVMTGNADAVITDQAVLAYYAATGGKGKAKTVGPLYHGEQFGFAFPKDSKWLEPTNKALATIKTDGTYRALYKKWFDKEPPTGI